MKNCEGVVSKTLMSKLNELFECTCAGFFYAHDAMQRSKRSSIGLTPSNLSNLLAANIDLFDNVSVNYGARSDPWMFIASDVVTFRM